MEELWKMQNLDFRLRNLSDRAEYDALRRHFREEEQRALSRNLLYGGHCLASASKPRTR